MYNVIAYISFFISNIAILIFVGSFFFYSIDSNVILILSAMILGFGQIYHKLKTKPISQAIKEYWNSKINKKDKNTANTIQTYEEYKQNKKK